MRSGQIREKLAKCGPGQMWLVTAGGTNTSPAFPGVNSIQIIKKSKKRVSFEEVCVDCHQCTELFQIEEFHPSVHLHQKKLFQLVWNCVKLKSVSCILFLGTNV